MLKGGSINYRLISTLLPVLNRLEPFYRTSLKFIAAQYDYSDYFTIFANYRYTALQYSAKTGRHRKIKTILNK